MIREHEYHVPSVETSEETAADNSLRDFLDRVDGHDRSLFTEGIELTQTKAPDSKPAGLAGQLYDAQEGIDLSPVINTLWSYAGVAPLSAILNENGMLPHDAATVIGTGINGYIEVTTAGNIQTLFPNDEGVTNPNITAISSAVSEGRIPEEQKVVVSRPISELYRSDLLHAAD